MKIVTHKKSTRHDFITLCASLGLRTTDWFLGREGLVTHRWADGELEKHIIHA